MTLSLHQLFVAANRLAVLTTTHGATHAVADALVRASGPLVGRMVRMHTASLIFVLLCAIGSIACHRKAAAEAAAPAADPIQRGFHSGRPTANPS